MVGDCGVTVWWSSGCTVCVVLPCGRVGVDVWILWSLWSDWLLMLGMGWGFVVVLGFGFGVSSSW